MDVCREGGGEKGPGRVELETKENFLEVYFLLE